VTPKKTKTGQLTFSFHDMLSLREANSLIGARIASRRVHRAIRALRTRLPPGVSLTKVHLSTEGKDIVVVDGNMRWNVDSGQMLFPFTPIAGPSEESEVIPLLRTRSASAARSAPEPVTIRELYERATALEASSPSEAIDVYRQILEREPEYADAHVNLGRLLHESNDVYAALVHYRAALSIRPGDPTAAFNTGVALEDLGANMDAIIAYRRAIERDPCNPDAHYNLARLLEQVGKPDQAVRHLLLYRQLTKKQ
jgi:hypothetical protein